MKSFFFWQIGEGTTGINEFILANLADYPIEMAAYRRFIGDSAKQVRDFLASGVTDEEIDTEVETLIQFEMQLAQVRTSAWVVWLNEIRYRFL